MQQHRRRRGLAASAVIALAVTGLAYTAAPVQAADDDDVRLISQMNGKASVRADGAGSFTQQPSTSITLVAERLDPDAVVSFEVNPDPAAGDAADGWTTIGGPAAPPGRFVEASWNGVNGGQSLVGTSVALRAVAVTGSTTTYSTRNDVAVTGQGSSVNSVSVEAPRGYFVQPYADSARTGTMIGVRGTTSASSGTVELAWWRASDGTFQGQTDAAVAERPIKISSGEPFGRGGGFDTVMDITGYDADASGGVLAVRAERDTDEVASSPVYAQVATAVNAGPAHLGVTSTGVRTFISVGDQDAWPVAGAEIRRVSDGEVVGYTNAGGTVEVVQDNETTETYYVNTTDTDAFEEGTDPSFEYTAPAYEPVPTSLKAVLADGDVFDDDEYDEGDVAIQVLDQEGTPLAAEGQEIYHSLSPNSAPDPAETVLTTDEDGRAVVPFDPSGPDGEYTLSYYSISFGPSDNQKTFVAGDARLRLTPTRALKASGGKAVYIGRLAVGDAPLAGRQVDLAYTRGVERAPGTRADAGILVGTTRRLAARVVTGADGSFRVTVSDPAEPGRPIERGGILRADATAAQEQATATTDFGVLVRLSGSDNGAAADRLVVQAPTSMAGERVELFRKTRTGTWRLLETAGLNRDGDAVVRVEDRNGTRSSRYLARIVPSDRAPRSRSNVTDVR